jgi:hypothetical protein
MESEPPTKEDGYIEFGNGHNNKKQLKAVLFKLAPMSDTVKNDMTAYVHGGSMDKDLRYAREVYGHANTSSRKDFNDFWESPWVEEHIRDTPKRKRIDEQRKSGAIRAYVKAVSAQETDDVDKIMKNVDKLTEWDNKWDEKESVKTVSRMIQSFEHVAVRSITAALASSWGQEYTQAQRHLLEKDIHQVCHTLRRHDALFDLFAALVASEISWANATSGTRNTPIFLTRQIQENKVGALRLFLRALNHEAREQLPMDTIGIPLMGLRCNMCVSPKGVLIVGEGSTNAMYVLDVQGGYNDRGELDLTGVTHIQITQSFSEQQHPSLATSELVDLL